LIISSTRTASGGGTRPSLRKRRTFAYEARSTSIANVVVRSFLIAMKP
jgi:hypothetical protein